MAKVVVIIPTYNERENTEKMIDTLADIFSGISGHEINLLYVDGNSPDGTAEVVKEKQKKYKWLHLIIETKKEGLGMAYMKGFQYAIKNLGADYLMEFDSDFQHRPQDIPRLVAEINSGYDFIVGSRYIKGGSIPEEWGIKRKFLSVMGNLVARILLILPRLHDVTGGFRLSRVKGFMEDFPFDKPLSRSFAYKIHTFYFMVLKGAKVKEVPIHFQPRTSGESKIVKNEMQETLRVIFQLQLGNPKLIRFVKFGTVGFVGFVVNYLGLEFFKSLGLSTYWATLIATEISIISNFIFNNIWTFKERMITKISELVVQFVKFNFSSIFAVIVQPLIVAGIVRLFADTSLVRLLALVFAVVFVVIPYNYTVYNLFIWKTWKLPKFLRFGRF